MLFLKQHDHPKLLDAGGLFLGMLEVPYETEIINLKKDMVLVFFTDGVTEAWDENEEEYGEDRLQKTVGSSFHKTSAAILTAIEKDVRKHVGEAQQSDDFTCVVCKVI
jgi:sigma-B regulation protein RsbU (phosphoserine phosphatase)